MLQKIAGEGPGYINAIKKRFLALNRERLARTHNSLRERQRDFLDLLPLLFHSNHPLLPGFVSKETPAGIADFTISKHCLDIAKKVTKTFELKRRALAHYDIQALYLMGSSGTVAYSPKSDFDIWVCHRQDLSDKALGELKEKTKAIEVWAAQLELEVHFFLIEPESFKNGAHEDMSAESSGSAQHYLLMEEFYRTGLLLAGLYPLWWVVPPEEEANYEQYVLQLKQKRFIRETEAIDFGGISRVPAEEFFGAALWQLYKGIDSPYKSVLKLMLMEVYADEYPEITLLSHRFKRTIYEGEVNLSVLDPYIMLYKKIEEYLEKRGENERLELLRRCFYFKVNEPLSKQVSSRYITWRQELMQELTASWGWDQATLEVLDTRSKWKIQKVLKERGTLVNELTFSYQFLSDFAREYAQLALIKQKDLNVLGRKLYAAFERKAGKVEVINRGISDDLWESHLTFYQSLGQSSDENWLLFTGPLNLAEINRTKPLKRSPSLVELVAWCHFNKIIDNATVFSLFSRDNSFELKQLKDLVACFQRLFPPSDVLGASVDDLSARARPKKMTVFINLGSEPQSALARYGRHLTTNRTDALSYGALHENLALSFDQITLTSWKEVLTSRYVGVEGLMSCIRDYLRWLPPSSSDVPPPITAHCFSFGRGQSISQRIEELFHDVVKCFYETAGRENARYIIAVEQTYYSLYFENEVLQFTRITSYADLLKYLGTGYGVYTPIVFDRNALVDYILPAIYEQNKANNIQLFYVIDQRNADVYVLDEYGSLFYQRIVFSDPQMILNHFSLFFDSVLHRQYFDLIGSDIDHKEAIGVEFFEVIQSRGGKPKIVKRVVPRFKRTSDYFSVQVIGELAEGGKPVFKIYCDNQEFTSLEYGMNLFKEVAKYVLSRRQSGQLYPIYITDIDLPKSMVGMNSGAAQAQTITFLTQKKNIEFKLNEALNDLNDAR